MTDLLDILFPKAGNIAKNCWIERWLKEKGAIDTKRFIEVMNTQTKCNECKTLYEARSHGCYLRITAPSCKYSERRFGE
jgi:hypothetical protein